MARVFVTGATGVVGPHLLRRLVADDHDVTAMGRHDPDPAGDPDVEWIRGDVARGRGLGPAWRADCVVHLASQSRGRMDEVNVRGTAGLLASMRPEAHMVYASVVGCDRHPLGYYQSKWRGEQEVLGAGRPWTIVRGTQTHELLWRWLQGGPVCPLGKGFRWQPAAAAEHADALADAVRDGPQRRQVDVGGPEILTSEQVVGTYEEHTGRTAPRLRVPAVGRVARAYREGTHCAEYARVGRETWRTFVVGHARDAVR